jgi:hypothetical protein
LVTVTVHDHKYGIDAILFDKDGTLVDFASLWLAWLDALLDTLGEAVAVPIQRSDLAAAVGADLISRTHDSGGPLAVGSNSEVRLVLAQRLYASGLRWEQACAAVESASRAVDTQLSEEALIDPAAGVLDFIERGRELGVRMGVRPGDVRETWLDVRGYVDTTIAEELEDSDVVRDLLLASRNPRGPSPFPGLVPPGILALTARPAGHVARLLSFGMMPEALRDKLHIPWSPRRERTFRAVAAAHRAATPVIGERSRHLGPTLLRLRRGALATGPFAGVLDDAGSAGTVSHPPVAGRH